MCRGIIWGCVTVSCIGVYRALDRSCGDAESRVYSRGLVYEYPVAPCHVETGAKGDT